MMSIIGRAGFTLVEMLVVLAIIAMLLGISVPFTSQFGKGLRIKTASRAILASLRVAKSNAITYRKKYSVVFDVENSQYWIEDSEGKVFERKRDLPSSIKFEIQDEKEPDPITFEDDRVIFYSTGAIEGASGSVTITDRQGNAKTISILGSTGNIRIE
ncbi:MAG: prepilin-type N-terminal cleavage/methylation domain-containing protein [Candidatus Omnitrophica bacterium]|nr:prepilin-type N-terminal cleavage/methylation domain-containing protein [Candidatus Omnitrophota bacterium]